MIIGEENSLTWGRARNCVNLIGLEKFEVDDCIDAVLHCQHLDRCMQFLEHECAVCYGVFTAQKVSI